MKYVYCLIALLFVAAIAAADGAETTRKIYDHNKIRAYSVVTPDGRRIIVATNRNVDPQSIAESRTPNRVVTASRTITRRPLAVSGNNRMRAAERAIPAAGPRRNRSGVPVCIWHGTVVSPIRVGDRLVCPSENSAYPVNP